MGATSLINIIALVYLAVMLVNIVIPTGLASPRGALFNLDWVTLVVMVLIGIVGLIVYVLAQPGKHEQHALQKDR